MHDIGWVAGMYEGEGSCYAYRSRHGTMTPVLCMRQKDPWPLQQFTRLFGGNVEPTTNRSQLDPHARINRWRISGRKARRIFAQIYPLLSPRRQEQIRRIGGV